MSNRTVKSSWWSRQALGVAAPSPAQRLVRAPLLGKWFEKYAVTAEDFNERTVGGKSCHLARLRRQLPEWIHLPVSVALPFGVFDRVLKQGVNKEPARRYQELTRPGEKDAAENTLAALRETVMALPRPRNSRPRCTTS